MPRRSFTPCADLKDFKFDGQHVIEVDEGNTAVIACDLPESHPKAQVRYSVKHEWLEASRGERLRGLSPRVPPRPWFYPSLPARVLSACCLPLVPFWPV